MVLCALRAFVVKTPAHAFPTGHSPQRFISHQVRKMWSSPCCRQAERAAARTGDARDLGSDVAAELVIAPLWIEPIRLPSQKSQLDLPACLCPRRQEGQEEVDGYLGRPTPAQKIRRPAQGLAEVAPGRPVTARIRPEQQRFQHPGKTLRGDRGPGPPGQGRGHPQASGRPGRRGPRPAGSGSWPAAPGRTSTPQRPWSPRSTLDHLPTIPAPAPRHMGRLHRRRLPSATAATRLHRAAVLSSAGGASTSGVDRGPVPLTALARGPLPMWTAGHRAPTYCPGKTLAPSSPSPPSPALARRYSSSLSRGTSSTRRRNGSRFWE